MQFEDDVAIISSGIGWAPAAAGSSIAAAAMMASMPSGNGITSIAAADGVLAAAGTPAVFGFRAVQGLATVSANGIVPWAGTIPQTDVDLAMNITDAQGNVMRSVDPADTLAIPANSFVLPADGTYYIWVAGTGLAGNYSSYGSMGQYFLQVEYAAAVDPQQAAAQRWVAQPSWL